MDYECMKCGNISDLDTYKDTECDGDVWGVCPKCETFTMILEVDEDLQNQTNNLIKRNEMTEIKIGAKALEVLKGMNNIHQSTVLREDYLYTKFESTLEDKGGKGEDGIIVNYQLPEGEVVLETPVGINNISEFLTILSSFDKDTLKLAPQGTTINIKDNRKKVTLYTATVDALPQRKEAGDKLYETGETIIKIALSDDEIEKINKDLNILNIDKLSLKSVDSKMKIVAENSITSNSTEIDVPESFVALANGDFTFPNASIFRVIMKGIYKIEVRKCLHKDKEILICKLISSTVEGLSYTMVQAL